MIKEIKVNKDTREVSKNKYDKIGFGIQNDNEVDLLRFSFNEIFLGQASLLTDIKDDDGNNIAIPMKYNEEMSSYDLEITKEMLRNENITFQLEIVNKNQKWHSRKTVLPIFKSLLVGEGKMPSTVELWLINANKELYDIKENEKERIEAENLRKENETNRKENESIRIENENERVLLENVRQLNEETRISSENIRKTDEEDRTTEENKRIESEILRSNNETYRLENESTRITNENNRIEAEKNREEYIKNFKKDVENDVFKGEKGDCNFAVFDIEEGELVMYKTENLLLYFNLNESGELEVLI